MRHTLSAAAALCLIALTQPAFSADAAVGKAVSAAVTWPWGEWITSASQTLTALLIPLLVGLVTRAVYGAAPWARLFLSQALIERVVQNAVAYALNAVAGAARDRALTVSVGSAVLAKAVQRVVDQAPGWVVEAAGGERGIAEKVFRTLHLEPGADAASVLPPASAKG